MTTTANTPDTGVASSLGRYLIVHILMFSFICIESWASVFFIPVLGVVFASISWLVYGVWFLWRIIQLIRHPSQEIRHFNTETTNDGRTAS